MRTQPVESIVFPLWAAALIVPILPSSLFKLIGIMSLDLESVGRSFPLASMGLMLLPWIWGVPTLLAAVDVFHQKTGAATRLSRLLWCGAAFYLLAAGATMISARFGLDWLARGGFFLGTAGLLASLTSALAKPVLFGGLAYAVGHPSLHARLSPHADDEDLEEELPFYMRE